MRNAKFNRTIVPHLPVNPQKNSGALGHPFYARRPVETAGRRNWGCVNGWCAYVEPFNFFAIFIVLVYACPVLTQAKSWKWSLHQDLCFKRSSYERAWNVYSSAHKFMIFRFLYSWLVYAAEKVWRCYAQFCRISYDMLLCVTLWKLYTWNTMFANHMKI